MTQAFIVDVLGLRVRIEAGDALSDAQCDQIRAAWSGALSADQNGESVDLAVPFPSRMDFDREMESLTVDVTLAALSALRGRSLMFHAAGVTDEHGRVAAFVGPSGRGKTTLSRELGGRYGYVSDETIAVAEDLSVSPYRKPLSVVRNRMPKQQISPSQAGLRDLPAAPMHLAALSLIERDTELAHAEIESVSLSEALPELVAQTSYLRDHPAPLQSIARLCDAVGGVQRVRYADASAVPALLPEILGRSSTAPTWRPAPTAAGSGPLDTSGVTDAIITDDAIVILAGSTVQVLGGIAPVIWLAAAAGEDIDSIVSAVIAAHGEPPQGGARAIIDDALSELIDAGALQRR